MTRLLADGTPAAPGAFDLHTHSNRSDGTLTPAEVVDLAAVAGLAGIALTDHDTTAGWEEAAGACARHGLEFVPGIELSAEVGGTSVHLLGYWGEAAGLVRECERLRIERDRRARAILARLATLGAGVREERVRALAGDAPLGRPHLAAALVEAGLVADVDEAFERYLGEGCPAYVAKRALHPTAAVRVLHDAGAVAVLAHPQCTSLPAGLLEALVAAGLDGIEADHSSHDAGAVRRWREEASDRRLAVTGGSDFHGGTKPVSIGARATSTAALEELRAARERHRAGVAARQRGRTRSW